MLEPIELNSWTKLLNILAKAYIDIRLYFLDLQGSSKEAFHGFWSPPLTPWFFTVSIFRATSLRYLPLTKQLLVTLEPSLLKLLHTPLIYHYIVIVCKHKYKWTLIFVKLTSYKQVNFFQVCKDWKQNQLWLATWWIENETDRWEKVELTRIQSWLSLKLTTITK